MNKSALLIVPFLLAGLGAAAQALPTVPAASTGFSLPEFGGQVSYAITASQALTFGYNGVSGNNLSTTNISGNLAYLSRSENHPFSMIYSGGFLGSETSGYPNTTFQDLSLSQVLHYRRNTIIAADTVSYLPQSPVVGLSGIPGVGDLGVNPVQAGVGLNGPGILTPYQRRVSNLLSVSEVYDITGKTSLHGTGSYSVLRFLGDGPLSSSSATNFAGYDSSQYSGSGGFTHRLDRRNSFGADYTYSRFTYRDQPYSFDSNGVLVEYSHLFTPNLVFDISAGPQFNTSSTFTSTSTNLAIYTSLVYTRERNTFGLAYSRSTNNGYGVVQGALSNSVTFTGTRRFSRQTSGSAFASYGRSSSISSLVFTPFSVDTEVVGVQANRGLGRNFSVFASYTLQNQSFSNAALSTLAYNGLTQTVGFGVTYSPTSFHMGRH